MPRSRQSRQSALPDVQPLGTAPSEHSDDAALSPEVFETTGADAPAIYGEALVAFEEFADASTFVDDAPTSSLPARALASDTHSSADGMPDHAILDQRSADLTDEFGAATVDLLVRIPDSSSASKSDASFSFAGWSAGTAPSQTPDDLPLHYGGLFAMQVEPLASGIHALDCAAGSSNGFEAVDVDAGAAPMACACCAFTFGSSTSGPQTDDYNLSGTKWGSSGAMGSWGGTVTWSFVGAGWTNQTGVGFFSGSTASLSSVFNFDYASVFDQAFAAWSSVANISFVQVADGGGNVGVGNSAYIRVGAGYIDGNYNVLARAFYPATAGNPQNYAYSGDMVFDSGESSFWTASSLLAVATHEIGHAIGLGHSSISNALMAPYYNPSITTPQSDDIAGARAIYGAAAASTPNDDFADHRNDTTASFGQVAVGGASTGNIEIAGDRDWFRVTLTAGMTYSFDLRGAPSSNGTLSDPHLYLYNSAGNLITFDADGGASSESKIVYTAAASGTYYLGAAAYNDAGAGIYRISVSASDPTLNGDGSDNLFVATAAREKFIGFGGSDTVSYAGQPGPLGVVANLAKPATNTALAAGDTYVSIENLIGSARADRLNGDAGSNVLEGGGGADRLDGDAGFDVASYANAASGVTANMTNTKLNTGDAFGDTYKSIEGLLGSAFNDILTGGKDSEKIVGGGGNDIINGGAKVDTLTGGTGRDMFLFASLKEAGDIITDFTKGDDLIEIVRKGFKIDARVDFDAGGMFDFANAYFVSNATGLATASGHGQFVFNQTTDQLLWDPDGAGRKAGGVVASFSTDVNLTAYDFDLI